MAGKEKFKKTVITDSGRHILIWVSGGKAGITYTKAVAYGQDVNAMATEDIRALTDLTGKQMETAVVVSNFADNSITVSADFNNKNLTDDISFNTIGWFAKIDKDDTVHGLKAGQEYLLGVTPANGTQVLAGAPPDHRSSQSIAIDLDMAISDNAQVNMTVTEAGIVHKSDLTVEITNVKNDIDKELVNYCTKNDVYTKADVYNRQEVDKKIAGIDVSGQVSGKANKADVDKELATKADVSNVFNKTEVTNMVSVKMDKTDAYTKKEVDDKLSPITTKQNDHENRLKYLEDTQFMTKVFTKDQEAQAAAWESAGQQGMRLAIIQG